MADVEDCSPPADPCSGGCWKRKAALTTILHVVVVTILLSVNLAYVRNRLRLFRNEDTYYVVPELVAYAAVACLYICNSSGWQEKMISAGYLGLVQFVFILVNGGIPEYIVDVNDIVSGTNIVATSSYCVWKFCFIILHSTRLKKIVRTFLHVAVVAILLFVIIITYYTCEHQHILRGQSFGVLTFSVRVLVQLVAYNAVGCLYICNSSGRTEKVISAGFLVVLVLLVFLLSSFANINLGRSYQLIFWANIVALFSYCVRRLSPPCLRRLSPWLRRCLLDAPGAAVAVAPSRQPAQQEAEAVLQLHHHQTPSSRFRNREVLREFSSDQIQAMTQDFGSMIGRGGSAQVFRGSLDDGTPVAVKRINIHSGRTLAGEEDFRRELSIIANVHQRSLVRLLGYCLQRGGGLHLVYPFFENGSLDRWIFHGSEDQRRQLTWPKRLGIAVNVARALAYLHNECHWRILHLDVKPGNILLDGDLRAHVSDFGISLSITRGMNSVVDTEHLKGTFGYMAPEMLYSAVSDKSDVFSYGMTLLELVGGRRNMYPSLETPDLTQDYFPYIVRDKVARGEALGAVDAAMAASVDDEEAVKTVLKVALCCIQNHRELRPSMQTVVDMLEGKVAVDLPSESRHHLL